MTLEVKIFRQGGLQFLSNYAKSKIEKVPMDIQGEKSRNETKTGLNNWNINKSQKGPNQVPRSLTFNIHC